MAEWTRVFEQRFGDDHNDLRLDAAAYHRNHQPILDVLKPLLTGVSGHALEIASGTGQHVVEFAKTFPDITWWPTDYEEGHVVSVEAWRRHAGLGNVMPPSVLDAAAETWVYDADEKPPLGDLNAIICLNVFHIAPWAVGEGILRGAGSYLRPGGMLVVYGPFKRDGKHTAESNERFDLSLRSQDPTWGVRDTADLAATAAQHGLRLDEIFDMPANNFILKFIKR